jgi:protein TonB
MLAYAANRPVPGKRQSSPNALLVVISVHVALLAVVMSAKMDLPGRLHPGPRLIDIPIAPPAPPPSDSTAKPRPQQVDTWIDHPTTKVPTKPVEDQQVDTGGTTIETGSAGGTGTDVFQEIPKIVPTPIHHDARLLTPASELKPPYPPSKLLSEEEAVLRLRLTIDENGRVVAVDPAGPADATFLNAARRYLIAHWRYQPATEDGRAITSSMVITLRFQLDA